MRRSTRHRGCAVSRALLSIIEHDDVGTDFFDTDGTDGGDGDDAMAIVLERIAALCVAHKLPIRDVAEAVGGFAAFLDDAIDLEPNSTPPPTTKRLALTVIPGGKAN
jgi:hypothetical protein